MKYIIKLALLLILFYSCKNNEIQDNFVLLPKVKNIEYSGESSSLNHDSEYIFHSETNSDLPVLLDSSFKLIKGDIDNNNLSFKINNEMDIPSEGYYLNISKNGIDITAKDEAGLFYSFNSLRQLIADSKDQNINLPGVKIKDYPSLKYRSIHIDFR
jgi:hexosaminidase